MVRSLLKLSAKAVADELYAGNLSNIDYELDETLSNLVFFGAICENRIKITVEVMEEVAKKFHVSKVSLIREVSKNSDITLFSKLKPKKLIIRGFETLRSKYKVPDDSIPTVDIVAVLKDLLSEEAQKDLAALEFSGYAESFPRKWMRFMSQMLPSLRSLDVGGSFLNPNDFRDLCANLGKLEVLHISRSLITKVGGISKLSNLTVLSLNDIKFNSKDDMMDLFDLTNLRVLEIAGWERRRLQTLKQYISCEKCLPELIYMDCSQNEVTEDLIEKLAETHPKLRTVALIGSTRHNFQVSPLTLLTTTNVKECVKSLRHYIPFRHNTIIGFILESLQSILRLEHDDLPEKDVYDCLEPILASMQKYPKVDKNTYHATNCLGIISIRKRINKFNTIEKHKIINAILVSCSEFRQREYAGDYAIHVNTWLTLRDDVVLATPHLNYSKMYYLALEDTRYFASDHEIVKNCLETMCKIVEKCNKTWLRTLDRAQDHLIELTFLLHAIFRTKNFVNYRWCMKLIYKYVKVFPEKTFHAKSAAAFLVDHLISLDEDSEDLKVETLTTLASIMTTLDRNDNSADSRTTFHRFCNRNDFRRLLELSSRNNIIVRCAIVLFFVSLFLYSRPATVENYEDTRENLADEIVDSLEMYPINSLEALKAHREGISNEMADWINWIVQQVK